MVGVRLLEQNQVFLSGRLTRDPEVFFTAQGTAKCSFSLAVNQNYRDKASGEWKSSASYIPVIVWREAAQRCKDKLKKGSPVHIEGRLRSRDFEDKKTGSRRTVIEVEARRVQFLAAPGDGSDGDSSEGHPSEEGHSRRMPAGRESAVAPAEDEIEDVPF